VDPHNYYYYYNVVSAKANVTMVSADAGIVPQCLNRLLGVPTGTPNIAITKELGIMSTEQGVNVKKLLEYHGILQINNPRLPNTACV